MPDKTDLIDRVITFLKQEQEIFGRFDPDQLQINTNLIDAASSNQKEFPDAVVSHSVNSNSAAGSQTDHSDVESALNACETLEELRQLCADSEVLRTDLENTNLVFGVGNPDADLMLIGEAPGMNEDKQGEPFVGKAGQLLNKILKAIHFEREDVYIANILKHRPPQNRDPKPEERLRSLPFLYRQIEIIDPKLILCLGRVSAHTLLDTTLPMKSLRGKFHRFMGNRELLVTFHPAALLRNPGWKRDTWEDVQKLRSRYDELTS